MDNGWIWSALALGKLDLIKNAQLGQFDWNEQHVDLGTPLIAIVMGKSLPTAANEGILRDFMTSTQEEKAARLELIKLAISRGADPHVRAPSNCRINRRWWRPPAEKEEKKPSPNVEVRNSSALTTVMKCMEAVEVMEPRPYWKPALDFLSCAMRLLNSFDVGEVSTQNDAFQEAVVDTWDRVLNDQESADVILKCSAGCEVHAHSNVLRSSSKVLRAMLSSSFREGATSRIELEDVDAQAVKVLLELLYTGTTSESLIAEDDKQQGQLDITIAAFSLAHQWQIQHVVQMLKKLLAKNLTAHSFPSICEAALRLDLSELTATCRFFASSNPDVRQRFNAGEQFPDLVNSMLRDCFNSDKPKRRKLHLHM